MRVPVPGALLVSLFVPAVAHAEDAVALLGATSVPIGPAGTTVVGI